MTEVWLHSNRRAAIMQMLPFAVHALATGTIAAWSGYAAVFPGWLTFLLAACSAGFLALVIIGWYYAGRPRLTFDGHRLMLNVRRGPPIAVPAELVEGFLLGQGPASLKGRLEKARTATLVVRIAERAAEFEHVETAPMLAAWCGHYCTLRGTWTEPLSVELVNRLNRRLHEVRHAEADRAAAVGGRGEA